MSMQAATTKTFRVKVFVSLKQSVLDPQGQTVLQSLHTLGFTELNTMRVGKYFEMSVAVVSRADAEARVKHMCEALLVNPVIEEYSFLIDE